MARIFTDDVQKLASETGLSRDEALRLLRQANGDYRKALRMHQEAFTVYIEPEHVEDDPNPVKSRALHMLNSIFAMLLRMVKSAALRRTLILIAIMLALTSAPHISGYALLILLMIRLAGTRRACTGAAA